MAQEVPRGPYAMGRVSIGAQWTAVASGFLLSPLFVVFMVSFVGWLVYCRLWPRRRGGAQVRGSGDHLRRAEQLAGSPARRAGQLRGGNTSCHSAFCAGGNAVTHEAVLIPTSISVG